MLECMNAVQSHGVPHRAGYHRGRTSNGCLDLQEASSLNTNAAPHAVCNFAFICTDQQITCFKLLSYTGTCKETRQGNVRGVAATQPRECAGFYRNETKGACRALPQRNQGAKPHACGTQRSMRRCRGAHIGIDVWVWCERGAVHKQLGDQGSGQIDDDWPLPYP